MQLRRFGNTDMMVSPIIFGTWEIGGYPFFQEQDNLNIEKIFMTALESGINFFDTAPVYGFGRAEEALGSILRKKRDQFFISDKCGLSWKTENANSIYTDASRETVMKEINLSLKRLNTDYIDLYLLHWPDKDTQTPIGETIEAFEELKHTGKIRYYGLSNFKLNQLKEAQRYGCIDAFQSNYNLLFLNLEQKEIPYLMNSNIAFQAYSPLARGYLTSKEAIEINNNKDLAVDFYAKKINENKLKQIYSLKEIAKKYNAPFASFVLACTLTRPGITTVIVGTQNIEHLKEAIQAYKIVIAEEDLMLIESVIKK